MLVLVTVGCSDHLYLIPSVCMYIGGGGGGGGGRGRERERDGEGSRDGGMERERVE